MEHKLVLNLWSFCQGLGRKACTHYASICKGFNVLDLLHTSTSMYTPWLLRQLSLTCSLVLPAFAPQWFGSFSPVAPGHRAQSSTEEQSYLSSLFAYFGFNSIANSLRSDQVYHWVPNSEQLLHTFFHTHKWKLKCQSQLRVVAPGWSQQSVGLPQVQDQPGINSETFSPKTKNKVKIPYPRPIQIK